MKTILTFILDRAKERGTWMGLIAMLSAIGVTIQPDQKEAIITLGVALAGAVATFTPDK